MKGKFFMSKTKTPKTYYAVTGLNAYGIFTDLQKARNAAKYVVDFKGGKFTDLEHAKVWATNTLFSMQPKGESFPVIPFITRLNWLYHKEKRKKFIPDD